MTYVFLRKFNEVESYTAHYKSPIGTILLTSDGNNITGVIFSKAGEESTGKARIHASVPVIKKCMQQLDEYFLGTRKVFDLPIINAGTEFQENVWRQLTNIPYGNTTSYLSLSKLIGNIKAIRAVGAANGKNNISIIVPCHRVIGSTGEMVGYGGEVWRKKWLLEHEARYRFGVQTLF